MPTTTTSKYAARISESADGAYYTYIIRIDRDGDESVIRGYKCRHFATRAAAERSTAKYIAKLGA